MDSLSSVLRNKLTCVSEDKVRLEATHTGALLRAIRFRAGSSQADAAERFGFSRSALSRWELGEREADDRVVDNYIDAFAPTAEETYALRSREASNPFSQNSDRNIGLVLEQLRNRRLEGSHPPLDLSYLAADAALLKSEKLERMRLYDSYIECLAWQYRHREAYYWASINIDLADQANNHDFVGRAVRATAHQVITEMRQPERGLKFLAAAVAKAKGSESEAMIAREQADRLAQAGLLNEAVDTLKVAAQVDVHEAEKVARDCGFVRANIAVAGGYFKSALNSLPETSHPDPYMQNHLIHLVAEARHGLGDRVSSQRVLEDGIRLLDKPGLRHFAEGLKRRLEMVAKQSFDPNLWKWDRSRFGSRQTI